MVLRLSEGEPCPSQVRVVHCASVATDGGTLSQALAGTVVEILASGGQKVHNERLVRPRSAPRPATLSSPTMMSCPAAAAPTAT